MTVKNTKARHFGFLLYPDSIPNDWKEKLESLGISMAVSPLHDMDEKKDENTWNSNDVIRNGKHYKKPHYHVIYIARNPVTIESVRNKIKRKLGNSSIAHVEILDYILRMNRKMLLLRINIFTIKKIFCILMILILTDISHLMKVKKES